MNKAKKFLSVAAISLVSMAQAQSTAPRQDAPAQMPPSPEGVAPANSGIVTTPPATGTESKTIRVPPKQIDPAITKPTDQIDRQNQQKSRDKQEKK